MPCKGNHCACQREKHDDVFFFFLPVGRVTLVRVAMAVEKGSRGTWPLREKLTNELHY